jgi:hypothetical protein
MSLSVSAATTTSPVNINSLLAQTDAVSADAKKDASIERKIHHDKQVRALDQSIGAMKDQQAQTKKAGMKNFIMGLVSTFLNMVTQVINFVAPGAGAAISNIVNGAFQGVIQQLSQNPSQGAQDSQIEAQKYQQVAENEQYQTQIANEQLDSETENQRVIRNRMEKAMQDMQEARQATLKV